LGGKIERVGDFLKLEPGDRAQLLASMTALECAQLFHDWEFWARSDQAPPAGDWIIWLILAGRGAGKTRAGAEAVRHWVKTYPIVNLIGATVADMRDTMITGESGASPAAGATSSRASSPPTCASNGRTAR
jgi:phage terminase large subunit-like protein